MWLLVRYAAALTVAALLAGAARAEPDIRQRIEAEVERHGGAAADTRVRVDVDDGAVLLRGTVRWYRQKMLYEQVAWQTPGVREVESEIEVVPLRPVSDEAIERQIVELAKLQRFQGCEMRATVRVGMVTVTAVFHDPGDVFFLKHRLADMEGVRGIAITARFSV